MVPDTMERQLLPALEQLGRFWALRRGKWVDEALERISHLLRCLSCGADLATARRFLAQIRREGMDLLQQRLT